MQSPTWTPFPTAPTRSRGTLVDPYEVPLALEERSPQTWPGANKGRIPWNKGRRVPPTVLTPHEVRAMIDACRDTMHGKRNRGMIAVMYGTGMRVNEMRHLRAWDIDEHRNAVRIVYGRGQTTRTVGIDPTDLELVVDWRETRTDLGFPEDAPLFCTRTGRVISRGEITRTLKTIAGRAGITKRVHSHAFRHSLAYELAMDGVPWIVIRQQLGHVWATSTERYISHLAPDMSIAIMRDRFWHDEVADADFSIELTNEP